jgi:hypothetical protein
VMRELGEEVRREEVRRILIRIEIRTNIWISTMTTSLLKAIKIASERLTPPMKAWSATTPREFRRERIGDFMRSGKHVIWPDARSRCEYSTAQIKRDDPNQF